MEIIQEADFRRRIKNLATDGGKHFYLFFGEEDYTKNSDLSAARSAVCPDESLAFFNDIRIDPLNFTPDSLLDAVMPMPMMTDKKIVSVSGFDFGSLKKENIQAFADAFEAMASFDYNVVIISSPAGCFDYGILPTPQSPRTKPRPSALLNQLGQFITPVYFPRNTPAQLSAWVQKHFTSDGVSSSPDVCRQLVSYCGTDMFVLASEISKLTAFVRSQGRDTVTSDDITMTAIRVVEYGAFDFSNAILAGNRENALNILADMKAKRADPIVVFSEVSKIFCDSLLIRSLAESGLTAPDIAAAVKLPEGKVAVYMNQIMQTPLPRLQRAVSACSESDFSMKLSGKDFSPLEQLICMI